MILEERKLTSAEEKVLAAFRAGYADVDVEGAEIRGDFLRGLFLDEKADYRGTVIVGAIISDVLNMEFCETKFPVRFRGCSFAGEIKLQQLTCPELDLSDCTLKKGLDAPCAKIAGGVSLKTLKKEKDEDDNVSPQKEFKAEGQVNLAGAVIGGQLNCSGGSFQNENGKEKEESLFAQGIEVADVFLSSGFNTKDGVSLAGAKVKGQLNCEGGNFQIRNKEWYALNARNIKVTEDVLLTTCKFNAQGMVRLVGADIGRNLELNNGKLTHLSLAGANVSGEFRDDAEVYKKDQDGDIKLDIDGFRYQRLNAVKERTKDRLKWAGMSQGGEFRPQPYEQLMKVYRATGYTNEAREVGFALEQKRQEKMERGWWRGWYEVLRLTIGYGYRPYRFLWWFFGIILGGGLLFSGGLGALGWALLINVFVIGALEKTPKLMWVGLLGFILCVSSAMAPCAKWESAESFWKHIPTVITGVTNWDGCETWRMHPMHPSVYLEGGEKTGGEERPGNHPQFIPLLYAAETAFPLFPLGQTGNWHPATWWVKFIQWFITLLGTVVLAILVLYGAGLLGPRWRDE